MILDNFFLFFFSPEKVRHEIQALQKLFSVSLIFFASNRQLWHKVERLDLGIALCNKQFLVLLCRYTSQHVCFFWQLHKVISG